MKTTLLTASVAAICVTALPRSSCAQAADPATRTAAVALFDEAEQLMAANRFSEACPKYAESYRNDPQLGALLHLADCLEKSGQFASAYGSFREATEIAERRGDERVTLASERANALESRINRLVIEVAPDSRVPGLQVLRDGLLLNHGSWGIAMPVDPGDHVIEARATGYRPWRTTLTITGEGRQERFTVPALVALTPESSSPTSKAAAGAALAGPKDTGSTNSGSTRRLLGIAVGSAGVVVVGIGVGFLLRKNGKLSDRDAICPSGHDCEIGTQARIDALTESARSANTVSTIGFLAGGVAIGAGAYLYFTAPKTYSRTPSTTRVMPWFGPGGTGVFAEHRF